MWIRPKTEITPEQYKEFYKSLSHSWDEPWLTMHNKNEGSIEFTNLLFIPSNKPYDLFSQNFKKKVKLYIKRVFISDENIDLVPSYLRFLSGVVDSEDLPLNISRETLQHNTILEKIRSSITQRVISELKKKKDESIEEYLKFWDNFGAALKEGLCEMNSDHARLLEVSMFRSSLHDKMISLDEYISNLKEDQKTIYYLSGDNITKLLSSPQIEGFLNKGIDVLLFTDAVDNFWVNTCSNYKDYEIKSATRSNIDLEKSNQEETNNEIKNDTNNEYKELVEYFKQVLGNLVKDVKISKKLTSSIACLTVGDSGMDINMERLLMSQNRLASNVAKILELNPKHPIIKKINNDVTLGNTSNIISNDNEQLVKIIFDQACIIEGQPLHDAAEFSKRINDILEKVTLTAPLDKTLEKRTKGKVKKLA